jgi:hypothetical protein
MTTPHARLLALEAGGERTGRRRSFRLVALHHAPAHEPGRRGHLVTACAEFVDQPAHGGIGKMVVMARPTHADTRVRWARLRHVAEQ